MTKSIRPLSPRTQVRRQPSRGAYDRDTIHAFLDAILVGHVGFNDPEHGHPTVIPTLIARIDDDLLFHTSRISRLAEAARGAEICVSAMIEDGLVLAKSAFHHSMNYRSVVAFGKAREIVATDEKYAALTAFTDKLVPGRGPHIRPPSAKELNITAIFALSLEEASAKSRTGGPADDPDDLSLPVDVGVIPITRHMGSMIKF